MTQGKKITHRLFTPDEYIFRQDNGRLVDEAGHVFIDSDFFSIRKNDEWEKDWEVWEEPQASDQWKEDFGGEDDSQ